MNNALFGEFMGTLVLILLGNGVVANVLLNKSKGENGGLDRHHHRMGARGVVRRSSRPPHAAAPMRT